MQKAIIGVVAVVIILGTVALVTQAGKSKPAPTPTPAAAVQAAQPIVRYNGSAFAPAEYTVKAGSKLVFLNISDNPVTISSADNAELNMGEIPVHASHTVTLTKTGTWTYHSEQNPAQTAKVTVQ